MGHFSVETLELPGSALSGNQQRRMLHGDDPGKRYMFATADRGLAEIAALLPIDVDEDRLEGELARLMGVWWPQPSVDIVAARFNDAILVASSRPAPTGPAGIEDPIGELILEGERRAREWSPLLGARATPGTV